jgi:ATP-dependent Lhr-like helicase
MTKYDPAWLDALCLAGRVAWARLTPPRVAATDARGPSPVRSTPIALVSRNRLGTWSSTAATSPEADAALSSGARTVAAALAQRGASFFDELARGTGLLSAQLEDALRELVAAGRVTCDAFRGLRGLLVPARRRVPAHLRSRAVTLAPAVEAAGRWALVPRQAAVDAASQEGTETIARTLLRRHGVVFKRVLERESALPAWRELLRTLHRLEARGEIRGGRFVDGFSGEQFATPEAVAMLRATRKAQARGELVSLSAADPLNVAGVLIPGPRVAAVLGNRLLLRDGLPIAVLESRTVSFLVEMLPADRWNTEKTLRRTPVSRSPRRDARWRATPVGGGHA